MTSLEPDPAVPQRDLLLDPGIVAARLTTLVGPIERCRQTRVKYRIGARLRVVHRIRAGGASYDVAASSFPTLERSERAHLLGLATAVPCDALPPVVHDRQLHSVFWTFPNDRKIAHLPALAGPATALAELLDRAWTESRLVAYAPEKTAAVRCLGAGGETLAYAKVYSGDEGERTARMHEALAPLAGNADVRVPRLLAYSEAHRTLVVEPIEGLPLARLAYSELRDGFRRLGIALARFHELPVPPSPRFRRHDADRLDAAAGLIGSVRSDVRAAAGELARELSRRPEPSGPEVCLHGDVNWKNVVLENGRVGLIDLDHVSSGPAAADLGSVLAGLRYARCIGRVSRGAEEELCGALLAGYRSAGELPFEQELRWHACAALLAERALRTVTRIRRDGLACLPSLLDEARRLLP